MPTFCAAYKKANAPRYLTPQALDAVQVFEAERTCCITEKDVQHYRQLRRQRPPLDL